MVDPIKERGYYRVEIYAREGDKPIDSTECKVGDWREIAFWLDNRGYIDTEYEIRVTVEIPL